MLFENDSRSTSANHWKLSLNLSTGTETVGTGALGRDRHDLSFTLCIGNSTPNIDALGVGTVIMTVLKILIKHSGSTGSTWV